MITDLAGGRLLWISSDEDAREKMWAKSKPQKIRLPAKPKNIMGPLLTSKAKKKKH